MLDTLCVVIWYIFVKVYLPLLQKIEIIDDEESDMISNSEVEQVNSLLDYKVKEISSSELIKGSYWVEKTYSVSDFPPLQARKSGPLSWLSQATWKLVKMLGILILLACLVVMVFKNKCLLA